jgi:hypothetical protein
MIITRLIQILFTVVLLAGEVPRWIRLMMITYSIQILVTVVTVVLLVGTTYYTWSQVSQGRFPILLLMIGAFIVIFLSIYERS